MNRTRMLILAGVALALSAVVTFMTYQALRRRLAPPEEMTNIVVVNKRVALGALLTESDVRLAPWPRTVALEGSFHNPADVVGRGVILPMEANEPVLASKLAAKEAGAGLTAAIPEGMRAVSVKVNDVVGVAGFVVPGTRVDVIVSGSPDGGRVEMSKIILENIQVLAAGHNVDRDAEGKPQNVQVVTLLVTPEESQKLALASVEGRIQLALRNPLDVQAKNTSATRRVALYSGPASGPQPAAPAERPRQVASAARRPGASAPVAAAAPAPTPVAAPAPPPPPPSPQFVEVHLIQGNAQQVIKFEKKD